MPVSTTSRVPSLTVTLAQRNKKRSSESVDCNRFDMGTVVVNFTMGKPPLSIQPSTTSCAGACFTSVSSQLRQKNTNNNGNNNLYMG